MSSTHDQKTSQLIATIDSELESIEQAMPTVYCNEGDRLLARKEYAGAMEHYNKALEIDSEHAPALFARGNVYVERGDIELAIEDLRRAADLAPNSRAVEVYARTLKLYIACMEEEAGRRKCDDVSDEYSHVTSPLTNAAEGNYEISESNLEKNLRALAKAYTPKNAETYYRRELVRETLESLELEGLEEILDEYLVNSAKVNAIDWSPIEVFTTICTTVATSFLFGWVAYTQIDNFDRSSRGAVVLFGGCFGMTVGIFLPRIYSSSKIKKWIETYQTKKRLKLERNTMGKIYALLEEKRPTKELSVETEVVAK
jgi:tetratricopeptide (TPR) repeat protein